MNRTRKLLAVCALALAAPFAIAACGGEDESDEDPAALLREAFTADTSYDSGVINIGLNGSLDGATSGTLDADISGPFNSVEGEPLELQLDANANVSAEGIPQLPGGAISFDFSGGFGLSGESLFVTYQDTTYEASEQLYSAISPLLETAESAGDTTQDPESADAFIDALDNLETEGTEDVEGESTTHVSGDLDFASLAESAEGATAVPFDPAQLEGFDATIDVFVSEDDSTFRRLDFGFTATDVEALAAQGVDGLDLTLSVGISEPNEPQTIEAPADTQPLDELLRQFGASESQILQGLQGALIPGGLNPGALGGGNLGTPGGAATDPQVQECISNAETSDDIITCLNE